ncbi:MAG: formate dehydrogenase accessory sulfurtransferase FdhD [Sphingomonas sp.]|jgi:FdhD protein|uniref:formate dehydrogenase accessory sulfurtransferase FdhD n=1 Tax=Sphingomonas sp. TaxID=28214 RepID=UPI003563BF8A
MSAGAVGTNFRQVLADGGDRRLTREVALERPVAVEFNGIGYAVMMATPADLIDFAYGFALAERLVDTGAEIVAAETHETDRGTVLRITLMAQRADRILDRVRHRVSESSCGLCGIENLDAALRPIPAVTARPMATCEAIFAALAAMRARQPLNAATGAVHAAMACGADGAIRLAREDVGRHNAFDKLIGAMARTGQGWDGGFALLSSRCSYELVEKAAIAGCPMLVTVSAPTSLALTRAAEAGLALISLARPDSYLAEAEALT